MNSSRSEVVLDVRGMRVAFGAGRLRSLAVDELDLTLHRGEILALIGESGSGKTATALALLGLNRRAGVAIDGEAIFRGRNLLALSEGELRGIRGKQIGLVFQNALTALNPMQTIGTQIVEMLQINDAAIDENPRSKAIRLLDEVGIPEPALTLKLYPHQLSGGMRQRVMVAIAIACDPEILIADEPTTALDASVQKQVLSLLLRLCRERSTAVLLITHDLGVVAEIADRVAVMYAGKIVELAPVKSAFQNPQHPYLRGLQLATPGNGDRLRPIAGNPPRRQAQSDGCAFAQRCQFAYEQCRHTPRLEERIQRSESESLQSNQVHLDACWMSAAEKRRVFQLDLQSSSLPSSALRASAPDDSGNARFQVLVKITDMQKIYRVRHGWRLRPFEALHGVSLIIRTGELLALIGESGSGKSTLGRCLLQIEQPTQGRVVIDGRELVSITRKTMRVVRQQMQMIFQDPYSSLNPSRRVSSILGDVLRAQGLRDSAVVEERVQAMLRRVGLGAEIADRYPASLSGGQRQRVGIGRALIQKPQLVVADECVSALDVSVQAQIMNLLLELREEFNLTYLLITHDLRMVRQVASRVAVMYRGRLVETGPKQNVFERPIHPYTRMLIEATPIRDPSDRKESERSQSSLGIETQTAVDGLIGGCLFHPRCPVATDLCSQIEPELTDLSLDRQAACHHPLFPA